MPRFESTLRRPYFFFFPMDLECENKLQSYKTEARRRKPKWTYINDSESSAETE